jgi:hypothetical protein
MLRFGQDARKLQQYFLPGKAERDIFARIRSRGVARNTDHNPVKVGSHHIVTCFTPLSVIASTVQ